MLSGQDCISTSKREWQDGIVMELCDWGRGFEPLCFLQFVWKTLATSCKTVNGWRRPAPLVWSIKSPAYHVMKG